MKILIDLGSYDLRNHGDISMLQVAVSRFSSIWPEATIYVITQGFNELAVYCPRVHPVWPTFIQAQVKKRLTPFIASHILRLKQDHQVTRLDKSRINERSPVPSPSHKIEKDVHFPNLLQEVDIVIATGGGYVTDSFYGQAAQVLSTIRLGKYLGKRTAFFGQGLGPVKSTHLRRRAAAAFRAADMISLREGRVGPALLEGLGVPKEKVLVTGDDAIELAYSLRPSTLGSNIGFNLRSASYSNIDTSLGQIMCAVLQKAQREWDSSITPIPISRHPDESDETTIAHLLNSMEGVSGAYNLRTPQEVIRQVGKCRVVVTGSYHAAVFALSQGIPVVCLTNSVYYNDKFQGLAGQFGVGCHIVNITESSFEKQFTSALDKAWLSAEQIRSQALAAAEQQIAAGRAAYVRFAQLLESRPLFITSKAAP